MSREERSPKRHRTPIESARNSAGQRSRTLGVSLSAPPSGVGLSQETLQKTTGPAPLYFDEYTVSFVRWE